MRKFIKQISKKKFFRNIVIVISGTAMAQIISMAFSPIITRLYGPEAFGNLGVFMSIVGIISPIAALTFPYAIVLPKNNLDARGLIHISILSSGIISLIILALLVVFGNSLIVLLNIEELSWTLYLIPVVVILSALLQVAQQWLIRTKQFSITAKVAVLNVLVLNSAKVGIGWFLPLAPVLIVITTLGSGLQALMLIKGAKKQKENKYKMKLSTLSSLFKRYKDFPIYRAPQTFINAISQSLPILLLASLSGPSAAGFYTISRTVLGMPTQLISQAVGDVFYPRIAEAANNHENITSLILKTTLGLAAIGIGPFGIVVLFGPWLFELVFGEGWGVAGEYARWLALWFFVGFINRPSMRAIPVLNLQGHLLIYEIVSSIVRISLLIIGFLIFDSDIYAIILFSLAGVVLNLFLITFTIQRSISYNSLRNF